MYLGYINSVLNPLIYDMDFKLFFNFFADSRFGHFWTTEGIKFHKIHDSFRKWWISKKSEKSYKGFHPKKIKLKCKFYESLVVSHGTSYANWL